jgi:HEPN domain-containing protein
MNEQRVEQWIILAEGDLKTAEDELSMSEPFTNSICFHAQQLVEKYLKAYLTFYGKPFRKTHDLTELINECIEFNKDFQNLFELDVDKLTQYSIDSRYPDDFYIPSLDEAKEAINLAKEAKTFIIKKFEDNGYRKN